MLKKSLVILIFALGLTVGFSASAASGTCPTDNGAGVGCNIGIGEYYCLGSCRTGQTQCPTWSGTVCATGLNCPANCTAADSCGYCNACASGYTLCGSYPSQTCTANTPVPANCSSYSQCTAVCSACAQGYELVSGACIGATLKLGSDSVGALNHIFQSTSPSLYVLSSGSVGIGTSTPAAGLEVISASGNSSFLAGLKRIGNVDIPFDITDAATKGYVDSTVSAATSSITLWGGTTVGNIWNLNGGSVGIGTNSPVTGLEINKGAAVAPPTSGVSPTGALRIGQGGTAMVMDFGNISGIGSYIQSTLRTNLGSNQPLFLNPNGGNVGIGTTTVGEKLTLVATSGSGIRSTVSNSSGNFGVIGNLSGTYGALGFNTGGSVWSLYGNANAYIGGNVGIGTTSPAAKLEVVSASGNSSILAGLKRISNVDIPFDITDAATKGYVDSYVAAATSSITLWGGTIGGNIWSLNSSNVGIGTTSPGAKLDLAGNALISGGSAWSLGSIAGVGTYIKGLVSGYSITDDFAWIKSMHNNTAFKGLRIGANDFSVWTGGGTLAQRLTIDASGNIGIGSSATAIAPNAPLSFGGRLSPAAISGGAVRTNADILFYDIGATNWSGMGADSSGNFWLKTGTGATNYYLVMTAGGFVGIGTTTPAARLDIAGSNSGVLRFSNTSIGSSNWEFRPYIVGVSNGGFSIRDITNSSERIVISSTGRVGIGTTTPVAALEVASASGNSNILAGLKRISNVDLPFDITDAATKGYVDSTIDAATSSLTLWGGTTGGNIWSLNSGSVGIGTAAPTQKLEIATTDGLGALSLRRADNTISANNELGSIVFTGDHDAEGSLGNIGAKISAVAQGTWGSAGSDFPTKLMFYTAPNGGDVLPRMTIDMDGRVGIGTGTSTLSNLLEIGPSWFAINAGNVSFNSGGGTTRAGGADLGARFNIAAINDTLPTLAVRGYTGGVSDLIRVSSPAVTSGDYFIIKSNGFVGIGTTTPVAALEVASASGNSNILAGLKRIGNVDLPFDITDAATKGYVDSLVSTATSSITLWGGTTGGNIWNLNSGNVGIGEAAPTYRLDVKGTTTDSGIRSAMGFDIYKVPDPIVIPTGVVSSGGSVNTGTHYYRLTYATEFGETSSIGSAVITTTAGNNTVTLTIPISTDPRVTSRKLYRSKAGASNGQEYYLATVNNNTDTTYIDTVADSTLTGSAGVAIYRANTTTNYISLNGTRAMVLDEKLVTFGALAGASITTGGYTTAIGTGALRFDTSGGSNTAVGYTALGTNATAHHSTAVGYATLGSNTGGQNTAVGSRAMLSNNIGVYNSVLGYTSLGTNTTGSYNVALGSLAGYYIEDGASGNTTGDYNVFIGADSRAKTNNDQNQIVIGYGAIGNGSDTATIGNDNILRTILKGSIGIGTTTPAAKLEVISASGNSNILAGLKRISNVDLPFDIADAATKGYVDSTVNAATSSLTAIAVFSASTAATYTGAQSGYTGGNALCNAASTGSHVCTTEEILYTVNSGQGAAIPFNSTLWISNGPPAYTANANDCQGWTSAAAADYGTVWIKLATGDGFGGLNRCNSTYKFACCK